MQSVFLRSAVAIGATGAMTGFFSERRRVHASWTTTPESPSRKWNSNWDHRDPLASAKPLKHPDDVNEQNKRNAEIESLTPKATRNIILIRHGQYFTQPSQDVDRKLTPLGREQADLTGKRLKEVSGGITRIVNSTMTRATETADIICKHIEAPREKCDFLREGPPCCPEPPCADWQPSEHEFFEEGARIEAAFRKYIHRADPKQEKNSVEVIVCHANVIRYFVCRALQLPPEAWLRFSLNNGSITWLTISPKGYVSVRCMGEAGYMPKEKLSVR